MPPPTRGRFNWCAIRSKPVMLHTGRNTSAPGTMPEPRLLELDIESLDLEGRGVAHHEGKVVFVEGALTGERVLARIVRSKSSYDKARGESSEERRVGKECDRPC